MTATDFGSGTNTIIQLRHPGSRLPTLIDVADICKATLVLLNVRTGAAGLLSSALSSTVPGSSGHREN